MTASNPFTTKTWPDGIEINCLRVPLYTQPDEEPLCFAFCVKMILEYYRNIYPDKAVRAAVNDLTIDEIASILDIREDGWVINPKRLQQLGEHAGSLEFIYSKENDITVFRGNLSNQKPKIVLFDKYFLLNSDPGWLTSILHSAVVIGLEDDDEWIVLNDPWGKGYERIRMTDFYEAWNRADCAVVEVLVRFRPKQTTLERHINFEEDIIRNGEEND